jgi:iron complex outermembrane recepter protein
MLRFISILCAMAAAMSSPVYAQDDSLSALLSLSMDELVNVKIVSASRRPESQRRASAAVFVITGEDIRRSGATNLPDALRLVPGVQVARIQSGQWAVTSRGFNSRTANKLLVLVDGRSVYSPFFSGVLWDAQDHMVEDIDRIEVVRGPGAALWGSNAVNGIINVITKDADETQGHFVSTSGGTEESLIATRYGGHVGDSLWYRVHGKVSMRDESVDTAGVVVPDDWGTVRGGLHIDWDATTDDRITVTYDMYRGRIGQSARIPSAAAPYSLPYDTRGTNWGASVVSSWNHQYDDGSDLTAQVYFDHSRRDDGLWIERRSVWDIDISHRFTPIEWNDIVWGVDARYTSDQVEESPVASLDPAQDSYVIFSVFVQDEVQLVRDRLRLTLGSKFEQNDYAPLQVQPSARLLWTPHENHTVWAAYSRAVRMPARAERHADIFVTSIPPNVPGVNPGPLPVTIFVTGNEDFGPEHVAAFEGGYRVQVPSRASFDVSGFYNRYDDLRTAEAIQGLPTLVQDADPIHATYRIGLNNLMTGLSYGLEFAFDWKIIDTMRLRGSYTRFHIETEHETNGQGGMSLGGEIHDPKQWASLTLSFDLYRMIETDLTIRHVGRIAGLGVPRYTTADARIGWRIAPDLEVFIVGRDLLSDRHTEFNAGIESITHVATDVERSVRGGLAWQF